MSEIRADRIYSEDGSTGPSFPKAIPSLVISGIATASQINVGTGVTINSSGINAGIVTATTFYGDASGLTNVPAGSSVTGNFTITNGNVVVSSGYGIDFSATSGTGTSELFDDYEEGTWTGTLKGTTADPSTPVTTTGYYTKIGNMVHIQMKINNANTTGASGFVSIDGLPFTPSQDSMISCGSYLFDFPAGVTSLTGLIGAGLSRVYPYVSGDSVAWVSLQHSAGTGRYLQFGGTYITNS